MQVETKLKLVELELAKVKDEAARLRKKLREKSRHGKRVDKAYDDALLLAHFKAVHINPSRSYARYHAMSQRRWENAMGLLRLARIVDGRKRWNVTDLPAITERLERARDRAKAEPEAFKLRLNGHANHEGRGRFRYPKAKKGNG